LLTASVAYASLLLASALIRLLAAHNQFWLDEVISWRIAMSVPSAWAALGVPMDNSHPLNTVWMHLLGDRPEWILYRIPALVAGVVAVGAAGWVGASGSMAEALLAMLLVGASGPMIHYSSEARGYTLAVALSLLSFAFLRRALDRSSLAAGAAAGVLAALGALSHVTFVEWWIPALAWTAIRVARSPSRLRAALAAHLPPAATLAIWGAFVLAHMRRLGAYDTELSAVAAETLARFLGVGGAGAARWIAAGAMLAMLAGALFWAWRTREDWPVFFGAILVMPPLLVTAGGGAYLFPRYFLVSGVWALLLLSGALGALWRRGHRVAVAAAALLFAVGNAVQIAPLMHRDGRGDYLGAISYLEANSRGRVITYETDNIFRAGSVMYYYRRFAARPIVATHAAAPGAIPEWYVFSAFDDSPAPPERSDAAGNHYQLVAVFGRYTMSGCRWEIYRNEQAS
jgi:hypothetical protein